MSALLHVVADRLGVKRGGNGAPEDEARDLHEIDAILADSARLDELLDRGRFRLAGAQPRVHRRIPGMGTVWDYRHMTFPNGGVIRPLAYVQHIPVIRQMDGRADLDLLHRVLVAQGLMVQHATDAEGNVALYTPTNRLCYHARGANALAAGVEHMHATTSEEWTEKQINAAAYVAWIARYHHGVPLVRGTLVPGGNRTAAVTKRGQVAHAEVSAAAGYHDRSDPGPGYPWAEVRERAMFFNRHKRF